MTGIKMHGIKVGCLAFGMLMAIENFFLTKKGKFFQYIIQKPGI